MNKNIFRPTSVMEQPFWEQVTYFPRLAPGSEPSVGYVLYRAKREDSQKDTVPPALKTETVIWILFQSDLDNAGASVNPPVTLRPKKSDVIQDGDGVRWTVMKAPSELERHSYPLECMREVG